MALCSGLWILAGPALLLQQQHLLLGIPVALAFVLLLGSNEVVIEEYIQIYILRGW
jgi:hypothetical protein